jgi:hypothetical protein
MEAARLGCHASTPFTVPDTLVERPARSTNTVVAAVAELGNRFDRELGMPVAAPVTPDMHGTLSEVYGRQKQLASFNHKGRRGR